MLPFIQISGILTHIIGLVYTLFKLQLTFHSEYMPKPQIIILRLMEFAICILGLCVIGCGLAIKSNILHSVSTIWIIIDNIVLIIFAILALIVIGFNAADAIRKKQ